MKPSAYTFTRGFLVFLTSLTVCAGARFADTIVFQQPRGGQIELRGTGNEFYAVYETTDGYTVVFDAGLKGYCYAALGEGGRELTSTGLEVGMGDPTSLGLERHLRIIPEAAEQEVQRAKAERDSRLRIPERWSKLKAAQQS